jgi:hypothetical protein
MYRGKIIPVKVECVGYEKADPSVGIMHEEFEFDFLSMKNERALDWVGDAASSECLERIEREYRAVVERENADH